MNIKAGFYVLSDLQLFDFIMTLFQMKIFKLNIKIFINYTVFTPARDVIKKSKN